jgi:hypothetical protein
MKMSAYAVYKNRVYELDQSDGKLELISNKDATKEGFKKVEFEQGFISKVLYVKEVTIDELDMAYDLEYKLLYKGIEFETLGVGKFSLENKCITVSTSDRDLARTYRFTKIEPFVFDKKIPLDEIDALIEIKKPILKFKNQKEERTKIEHKDIKAYLEKLHGRISAL